jgi:hypothetical protein
LFLFQGLEVRADDGDLDRAVVENGEAGPAKASNPILFAGVLADAFAESLSVSVGVVAEANGEVEPAKASKPLRFARGLAIALNGSLSVGVVFVSGVVCPNDADREGAGVDFGDAPPKIDDFLAPENRLWPLTAANGELVDA